MTWDEWIWKAAAPSRKDVNVTSRHAAPIRCRCKKSVRLGVKRKWYCGRRLWVVTSGFHSAAGSQSMSNALDLRSTLNTEGFRYTQGGDQGTRDALLGQWYARLELKGQIGVVVVNWDWGTGEWAKSSDLLSYGAAFGTGR
jgi:hypothetical protein